MCFFVFNPLHIHLYHLFTINDILSLSLSHLHQSLKEGLTVQERMKLFEAKDSKKI